MVQPASKTASIVAAPGVPNADFRLMFEAVPGAYLVMKPDFTVVAVSDRYLRVTGSDRSSLLGRGFFEALPGESGGAAALGASRLRASLELVLESQVSDIMVAEEGVVRS